MPVPPEPPRRVTAPAPTVEIADRLTPGQATGVVSLLDRLGADGRPALNDGQAQALDDLLAGRDGAVAGLAGTGALEAYGQLVRTGAGWEAAVVPARAEAAAPVLARLVAEAAERGGGPVRWWATGAGEDSDRLAATLGMREERTLLQLRCPLPLDRAAVGTGPALDVRPFDPGRDVGAWLDCNNRAFAGHPEQGGWDEAVFARRRAAPWFDPQDLLMAEEAGHLVGSCWTKLHPGPPVAGEIYVIGVDPRAQGRGIGRSLTVAGLAHLVERGAVEGLLYVDAANRPARALYASLGFTEHRRDRCYRTA
ncbi:MAG: mycothiol synthase [Actinomycetota bacterium]|jgi:mycothiol synthase|nr:mycothiol synthase [Actinomycetota bacterium]